MLTYLYSLIYLTSSLLFSITLVLRKGGKNGFLALKGETTIEKLHTTANCFITMYRMNKLYGKLERATRSLIYFTTRSWEVTNITLGLQFNLSLRTPLCYGRFVWSQKCQKSYIHYLYRVFSLTWPAYLQIYCNKRKRLHKKRVQLPGDWFRTPTWPPFHCFGTPIWPP